MTVSQAPCWGMAEDNVPWNWGESPERWFLMSSLRLGAASGSFLFSEQPPSSLERLQ